MNTATAFQAVLVNANQTDYGIRGKLQFLFKLVGYIILSIIHYTLLCIHSFKRLFKGHFTFL